MMQTSLRRHEACADRRVIDHICQPSLTTVVTGLYPGFGDRTRRRQEMSIRSTIMSQFAQVAEEQEVKPPPLSDELVLLDSGLDSLGFAILVARLEDTLGFDPFSSSDEIFFPVTLGDFVRVYEDAAAKLEVAS